MASSDDELSWASSSELYELEMAVRAKDELDVWQNNWAPVNPPSKSTMVALPSPSPTSVDAEDEQPSLLASRHRETILSSAERIKLTTKSRKRKASVSSPSGPRKKRAVGVTNMTPPEQIAKPEKLTVVPEQRSERKSGKTVPATPRKKKDNYLLPTPPSSLNIQSTSGVMLTTMSDLTSHPENTPLKYRHKSAESQKNGRKNGKTDVSYLSAIMPQR
ncbi:hypothetical protein EDD36DRAFT_55316 [Exophiala viscosa]|uniref:Uncharacterized protein n=1 Tax=Exophiala viscosa TaxID=2486360 RepID=A0AAN6I9L7_9EURO|nr:hypothetical protein EDD36DRAFT_55316 [Exophiala viscosa]